MFYFDPFRGWIRVLGPASSGCFGLPDWMHAGVQSLAREAVKVPAGRVYHYFAVKWLIHHRVGACWELQISFTKIPPGSHVCATDNREAPLRGISRREGWTMRGRRMSGGS